MRYVALLLMLVLGTACQQHLPTVQPAPPALSAASSPTPGVALRANAPARTPTREATASPQEASAGATKAAATVVPERVDYPTETPAAERPAFQTYTIREGDTLSGIAARFGISMDELTKANGITDPNRIRIGQDLKIPAKVEVMAPAERLIPDSELVYGPTSTGFDVAKFAQSQPGYLKEHSELVESRQMSGPEIVQLVAQRFSVSPRLLVTLLEIQGGWLSNPAPAEPAKTYPLGKADGVRLKLFRQLSWAADQINTGYYGWKGREQAMIVLKDGSRAKINPTLNAGTIGLQFMLAQVTPADQFAKVVAKDGDFAQTYRRLFGDPFARAQDPTIPPGLRQPDLKLPWPAGERWFFSGGPHGGWGSGSAWSALDFIPGPDNMGGCWDASKYWVTASAPGLVIRSDNGEVVVDLDGDGQETTGWNILYMHVDSEDRVPLGTRVKAGDRIGHPSCEGGFSTGTHLHMARKYNGEWMAADGPVPFNLSGWVAQTIGEYDGVLVKAGERRESCECRIDETNGLLSDNR